ncbi:MAG: hypothetical protein KY467_01160 [Gemmatimonadetes bacterium]|nr:hypothetical protein [Gemmatimonadota bacterium]
MAETTTAPAAERVLVIRGSEWLRARKGATAEERAAYTGEAALCSWEGPAFCCLGLDLRDRGVPKEALQDHAQPSDLDALTLLDLPDYPWARPELQMPEPGVEDAEVPFFVNILHPDADRAMRINDDFSTTDEEKIRMLTPIFARHGIRIDFRPEE